jgi:hypothetical protein
MVWSQYVYEATAGLDVDPDNSGGDEDHLNADDLRLNIWEWEIQYSEELWDLWDLLRMLVKDAYLEHVLLTECTYTEFTEFCFREYRDSEPYDGPVPFRENVNYWWHVLSNELKYLEFAPGASFEDFARFVVDHSEINNLTI